MRAFLLAAGVGSRLRPLTQMLPKPLVPFMNRPLMAPQLENLLAHTDEVRVNVSYLAEKLISFLEIYPRTSWVQEAQPLGSARTVWQERAYFDRTTFVACADILADYDVEGLLATHRASHALVSIATVEVDDPRPYGVLVSDPRTGLIRQFQEKPADPAANTISTGIYLFEPEVLDHWQPEWKDLGGDVFPALVAKGVPVQAIPLGCPWLDVGLISDYLWLQMRLLKTGNLIHPAAEVHPQADLQRVIVGAGSVIEAGVRLSNCIVWPDTHIDACTEVHNSVVTSQMYVDLDRRQSQSHGLSSGAAVS